MDTREGGLSEAAAATKGEVKTLLSDAKQEGARIAESAKDKVAETAGQKKDQAAEKIETLADVLRDAGQRLTQEEAGFGRYAESAAQRVEQLASYLRRQDVGNMVKDCETFARRHPELFLGAAFLTGMVAARFLKSSAREEETALAPAGSLPISPSLPATGSLGTAATPGYAPAYGAGYGYQQGAPNAPGYAGASTEPRPRFGDAPTEPVNPPFGSTPGGPTGSGSGGR